MRILILGGTAEARQLAARLAPRADVTVTLSLAGRTASPVAQPVPVRIGGFGGAEGLADYLAKESVNLLVDATHPYAAQISGNAARAAQITQTQLLAFHRPAWIAHAGDRWIEVAGVTDAVQALGADSQRVFVTLGRKEIVPFAQAPQHHYLVRSVDPVDPPLAVPHATYLMARGPFSEADERGLLEQHAIDVIVSKNSGGTASYGKIAAARALRLPVVMLQRPELPKVPAVETVEAAVAWIDHALASGMARGV